MNLKKWSWSWALLAVFSLSSLAGAKSSGAKATESLPDSSFASIEHGAKGEKIRHLPYRDAAGQVNVARLRSALRLWKKVKWQNSADAKPALALLKNAQRQMGTSKKMKIGKGHKLAKKAGRLKTKKV